MEREKGIAYCGLACAVCSENADCPGCRNEGCRDKDSCINLKCCRERGLNGCWECPDFPCRGNMLDNIRIRSFAKFIKQYGSVKLLDCLERNERNGMVYHYPGKLNGDYDVPDSEEEIMNLLLNGRQNKMIES
jgi:hypothetical protein